VAILPGSRRGEVSRILPDLVAAAALVRARVPGVQFVVARAANLDDELFAILRSLLPQAVTVTADTDTVLASADVALTASGTATVQAALHDTPMVIVYRVSPWTYRLGRHLLKVDTFGMVNLIAGSRIVPELIQDAFTPEAVAAEAVSMLTDPARAAQIRTGLRDVRERLGGGGASRRAAEAILALTRR
jgi:lipid-A-disaccharide synthase